MDNKPSWLQNEKIKERFDSLPKAVQENIMQASLSFNSAEELQICAENISGKGISAK